MRHGDLLANGLQRGDGLPVGDDRLIELIHGRQFASELPLPAIEGLGGVHGLRREERAPRELQGLVEAPLVLIDPTQVPERIRERARVAELLRQGGRFLYRSGRPQQQRLAHRREGRSESIIAEPDGDQRRGLVLRGGETLNSVEGGVQPFPAAVRLIQLERRARGVDSGSDGQDGLARSFRVYETVGEQREGLGMARLQRTEDPEIVQGGRERMRLGLLTGGVERLPEILIGGVQLPGGEIGAAELGEHRRPPRRIRLLLCEGQGQLQHVQCLFGLADRLSRLGRRQQGLALVNRIALSAE